MISDDRPMTCLRRPLPLLALFLTAACGAAVEKAPPLPMAEAPVLGGVVPATPAPSATVPPAVAAAPCRPVTFENADYTVCELDLRRYLLGLYWEDRNGQAYGTLPAFNQAMAGAGDPAVVAMNAGMYHPDLSPVGLFVAGGRTLQPATQAEGDGNFFMKPNGVFYVADGRAGVLETGAYLQQAPRAEIATQSGPMLVVGGAFHPMFSTDGPSRKIRNGIGVRDDHTVVFAISHGGVSFGSFARLFRDVLGCPNALYLDGSISALSAPDGLSVGWGIRVGPILAAFDRSAVPEG